MMSQVCFMAHHIKIFYQLNTLLLKFGIFNNYDSAKNYISTVENVQLVCGRPFPLQLDVVLVMIIDVLAK